MNEATARQIVIVRRPENIYQASGEIENGSFSGRWHFSFDEYYERDYSHFGTLRVFNDDTLSPGATWPMHPHRNIEVVTYCAGGEFCHADEKGKGGILKKGWVQHTTVGSGMMHAEINNRPDEPMRFVQMWFVPATVNLEPSLQQLQVERSQRTNRLLPLVSNDSAGALPIASDAQVFSSLLEQDSTLTPELGSGRGFYLYVLEGGPVTIQGSEVQPYGAAKIIGGDHIEIRSTENAELLLVEVPLAVSNQPSV